MVLRLEVLDFAGPARWRWRLTEAVRGSFVADHEVVLDEREWQYEAFGDLNGYLRWNAAPDRRLASEAELTAEVGAWIGDRVLGSIGVALSRAPQPVLLEVPAEAEVLAYRPWELAQVEGRALAAQRVTFVIDQFCRAPRSKTAIGERLRMLAVFSLPEGESALNLRWERQALARRVHEIAAANGKAVELRVLQYGATRTRLEDALLEDPGWDVVHISGHGLPAGLILEDSTGRRDLVSSRQLVELLELAADQIKLVTLSACESAAITVAEHLRLLGLGPPAHTDSTDGSLTSPGSYDGNHGDLTAGNTAGAPAEGAGAESLPALATELVRRLDCAVLAMRYPVTDDFAIALADSFYNLVLGKGQPVARALGLTVPRVAPDLPTLSAPALSVATPTLFGARAADLKLTPPPGEPLVFQAEQLKLASFPPPPARFVGRVGPMTRATTALAPGSGHTGVLFHGMAGVGKTACAVELAYTHEASFGRLVWHQAPAEGHDITTALINLALDLERQVPGLLMAHVVGSVADLRAFLPTLAEFLERSRVLLVLDNLESLLTEEGQWRDQRWELLIDTLCGHGGLSRVVLTSRRYPARLQLGIVVEPVNALSLAETVLLAREWPHLRSLIEATAPGLSSEQAHHLAAQTLAMVQGHPKLIELADGQAASPAALQARLAEADRNWLTTGTRLRYFLEHGESAATDRDYLQVLHGWTRGAITTLPDGAGMLFTFLCCLEPDDRRRPVIEATWARTWQQLGRSGLPPDLAAGLTVLLERALITVEDDTGTGRPQQIHIHPVVAETGRITADPDTAAAADFLLAGYWLTLLMKGIDHENQELGQLIVHAARAAALYLIRGSHWEQLLVVIQQELTRDHSSTTIAALLPLLHTAAEATHGTDLELEARTTYAIALTFTRPESAELQLRQLLDTAVSKEQYGHASRITANLIRLYRGSGRVDEALTMSDLLKDYIRSSGYGPWTQLGAEIERLEILYTQGHNEQVVTAVQELRTIMASLPESSDHPEAVLPWGVIESTLEIGLAAAYDLSEWEQALDINAQIIDSRRQRGASTTSQAQAAYKDYRPLLELGRTAQARKLLLNCRHVFKSHHEVSNLANVLNALAHVENELGHNDRAIEIEKDSLRLMYTSHDPDQIGVGHHNLANYLRQGGGLRQSWAHSLAATVIAYQAGNRALADRIRLLTWLLTADVESLLPESFHQVCEIAGQVQGVKLAELVARLPCRALDGQAAMVEVLRLARAIPVEEVVDLESALVMWEPVISGLVAADRGDAAAASAVDQHLAGSSWHADWQQLVSILRRIRAGEVNPTLAVGLDPIDTAVVRRAIDALNGTTPINPDAWHNLK